MSAASARPSRGRALAWALAGLVAVGLHGILAWRHLPPVNNDEYLPLFPLTWACASPAGRSPEFRRASAQLS